MMDKFDKSIEEEMRQLTSEKRLENIEKSNEEIRRLLLKIHEETKTTNSYLAAFLKQIERMRIIENMVRSINTRQGWSIYPSLLVIAGLMVYYIFFK